MNIPPEGKEEYLGDGLYVSFDGWSIRLRAPRDGRNDLACLEPDVWQSLCRWLDCYPDLKRHMESKP